MRRYNLAVNAAFILLTALLLYHYVDWGYVSQLDFTVVWTYRKALLDGLLITVMLVAVAIPVGLLFGILLAILYQLPFRPTRWLVIMHVEIWRGTPLLVQVFWVHFALPHFTGVNTSPMVSGLIALTLQASAYLTEVVRAGLKAVPVGQVEAALALDLPLLSRWCDIILPQALRVMIPPLADVGLSFLKATTILTALCQSALNIDPLIGVQS